MKCDTWPECIIFLIITTEKTRKNDSFQLSMSNFSVIKYWFHALCFGLVHVVMYANIVSMHRIIMRFTFKFSCLLRIRSKYRFDTDQLEAFKPTHFFRKLTNFLNENVLPYKNTIRSISHRCKLDCNRALSVTVVQWSTHYFFSLFFYVYLFFSTPVG